MVAWSVIYTRAAHNRESTPVVRLAESPELAFEPSFSVDSRIISFGEYYTRIYAMKNLLPPTAYVKCVSDGRFFLRRNFATKSLGNFKVKFWRAAENPRAFAESPPREISICFNRETHEKRRPRNSQRFRETFLMLLTEFEIASFFFFRSGSRKDIGGRNLDCAPAGTDSRYRIHCPVGLFCALFHESTRPYESAVSVEAARGEALIERFDRVI